MPRTAHAQEAILKLLAEHHVLSAPQIVEHLHAEGNDLNKTTVYRSLERLLEHGTLCRTLLQEEIPVYELRDHHHDHLICQRCGKIQSVACQTQLPDHFGEFSVDHHHLTIFGRCASCSHQI